MVTMEALRADQQPDFCVEVAFRKGEPNPERIFRATAAYIEALHGLDVLLVSAVDSKIKPVLLLESIESGSIKVWLKQFLEAVDNDALKNLDWKPAVGKYLVQAKYKTLKWLQDKEKIDSKSELDSLALELYQMAKSTGSLSMPACRPVSPSDLAQGICRVSEALSLIVEGESITLSGDDGDATLTNKLVVTSDSILELLSGESIANEVERILMVRRPDFLGDAMWEFRHDKKAFSAKITDGQWLGLFRSGEVVIRPGDALRVKLLETVTYGRDGEVLSETRVIVKVLGIIREFHFPLPV